jgi:hypothetical protein
MNRPRPCWAFLGTRPEVVFQLIPDYIYLYGAGLPEEWNVHLSDREDIEYGCFQIFRNVISQKSSRQDDARRSTALHQVERCSASNPGAWKAADRALNTATIADRALDAAPS